MQLSMQMVGTHPKFNDMSADVQEFRREALLAFAEHFPEREADCQKMIDSLNLEPSLAYNFARTYLTCVRRRVRFPCIRIKAADALHNSSPFLSLNAKLHRQVHC